MKALILSCNTGAGHNSCSRAIQECFAAHGDCCDAADALQFISSKVSVLVSGAHVGIYRHFPTAFRYGYRFFENHRGAFRKRSMAHRFFALGTGKMAEFIRKGNYDVVISTHAFSALMLTEALRRYPLPVKTAYVATDYTSPPSVEQSNLDMYFIPDMCLADEFASVGIAREKLIGSGIPVRQIFCSRRDRREAAEACGIPHGEKHILAMCGSMGCGPMPELTELVADRLAPDQHLTVACGTNKKLREKLQERYGDRNNVHIHGFVQDISLLMDSADLYLTKPGGLSTSEATAKCLPMVLVDAVSGCEAHNLRYFLNLGTAVTADTPEGLAELSVRLLKNEEELNALRRACEEKSRVNAAEVIHARLAEACAAGNA